MLTYDPMRDIDPDVWNATDEHERLYAIEHYHRRKRIKAPNLKVHASMHSAVENQIAMGDAFPARAALRRLMDEGLDRHEAVHAIGSLVAHVLWEILHEQRPPQEANAEYVEKLQRLTAAEWLRSGEKH